MTETTDLEIMQRPESWPHTTWLPVKRHGTCGFLYQPIMSMPTPAPKPVVYVGYPWNAKTDMPKITYETLQEIIDAGWVID